MLEHPRVDHSSDPLPNILMKPGVGMTDLAMPADHRGTPAKQLDESFAGIYSQYLSRVEGYIAARLPRRDSQLAEDLAAEVFISLWRTHYATGRDVGVQRPWALLATIAQRRIADHFRLFRNRLERPADLGHWEYSNREMAAAGPGYYVPAATGFRTAKTGGDK